MSHELMNTTENRYFSMTEIEGGLTENKRIIPCRAVETWWSVKVNNQAFIHYAGISFEMCNDKEEFL